MRTREPIVIVGAGIGGLTLAAALEARGTPYLLVEQAEGFSRVGAGIQMTPNAMKVLAGLGLDETLSRIAFHAQWRTTRQWDTGEELLRVRMGDELVRRYGAPHLLFHRGDLHQLLYEQVPAERIRFASRLVGLDAGDDAVELRFADGGVQRAGFVVAADGVHSVSRDAMFGPTEPSYTGTIAYRSVFSSSLLSRPLQDHKSKWRGIDRQISIYYVSAGTEVYFTSRVPHPDRPEESFALQGDVAELRDAFRDFHEEVRLFLAACPRVQKWAIYDRPPLPEWQRGRVVLLGDACHPMTPAMAQGAAMAMEDAVVLARALEAHGTDDVLGAFETYVKVRWDRASAIQVESSLERWNWTTPGSEAADGLTQDEVYGYDAWSVALQ